MPCRGSNTASHSYTSRDRCKRRDISRRACLSSEIRLEIAVWSSLVHIAGIPHQNTAGQWVFCCWIALAQ